MPCPLSAQERERCGLRSLFWLTTILLNLPARLRDGPALVHFHVVLGGVSKFFERRTEASDLLAARI